jgi:Lhr-like helicase
MIARTRNTLVVFSHPFELKGVDRTLPPGEYRVVTDEQLIEELSFLVYRRVSTMIFVPGKSSAASTEMVTIDPRDLQAAQDRDKTATHHSSATS